MPLQIPVDREKLADFCRNHRIRKLSFFGSVLREDFRPESDVDVLVEFQAGVRTGFRFIDIRDELARLVGRHVDMVTVKFLNARIRDDVLALAEVAYAQG